MSGTTTDVFDWDEMPVWEDWKPTLKERPEAGDFTFEEFDLSSVTTIHPDEFISEWDRTAKFVRENFPSTLKIPTGLGNGCNERLMRYVSESIRSGYFGPELRVRGHAFMRQFFEEVYLKPSSRATVSSMEQSEKRNHPERFNDDGEYIFKEYHPEHIDPDRPRKLIQMKDAEQLLSEADAKTYLIEPWLPHNTIVQVFAMVVHGKSMSCSTQCLPCALAANTWPLRGGQGRRAFFTSTSRWACPPSPDV